MTEIRSITTNAKPFLKWAGGKGQLLSQLDELLPAGLEDREFTYIEPFVGGGAMLFHMLNKYPNITKVVINDINPYLVTAYRVIKNNPDELIERLSAIEAHYYNLEDEEAKKAYFLGIREIFNEETLDEIDRTKYMMFLNRTCFNGLYRVNGKGKFNVPFGKYTNPQICDPATIRKDSELLQHVEILTGDFEATFDYAQGNTLFYFDPPYRPLSDTSSFNDYAKEAFNDDAQIRLKEYCDRINEAGFRFMLSNSDCKGKNEEDNFFDVLYGEYNRARIYEQNGTPNIVIRNYKINKSWQR